MFECTQLFFYTNMGADILDLPLTRPAQLIVLKMYRSKSTQMLVCRIELQVPKNSSTIFFRTLELHC